MAKYTHIDSGLDLLKEIYAIRDWSYQHPTNTYTVYGDLRSPGMNHKIYRADELAKMSATELYAQMIADFNVMEEDGKGFFYKVKQKLKDLSNRIIEYGVDEDNWKGLQPLAFAEYEEEQLETYQLLQKLMEDGKISKSEMIRCNELWQKYKKNLNFNTNYFKEK